MHVFFWLFKNMTNLAEIGKWWYFTWKGNIYIANCIHRKRSKFKIILIVTYTYYKFYPWLCKFCKVFWDENKMKIKWVSLLDKFRNFVIVSPFSSVRDYILFWHMISVKNKILNMYKMYNYLHDVNLKLFTHFYRSFFNFFFYTSMQRRVFTTAPDYCALYLIWLWVDNGKKQYEVLAQKPVSLGFPLWNISLKHLDREI